jgi:hypothetical protein
MKGATFGRGFVRRNRHYDCQGDGNANATLGGSIHGDSPSRPTLFQGFFNNSAAARCERTRNLKATLYEYLATIEIKAGKAIKRNPKAQYPNTGRVWGVQKYASQN